MFVIYYAPFPGMSGAGFEPALFPRPEPHSGGVSRAVPSTLWQLSGISRLLTLGAGVEPTTHGGRSFSRSVVDFQDELACQYPTELVILPQRCDLGVLPLGFVRPIDPVVGKPDAGIEPAPSELQAPCTKPSDAYPATPAIRFERMSVFKLNNDSSVAVYQTNLRWQDI